MFCRLLFVCLFKRSIALGVGVGLGLGIGLGLVLGLGLGVGLALGLGWVRFYMLQSQSARIKASLWRRIPRKNKRRQKILGNRPESYNSLNYHGHFQKALINMIMAVVLLSGYTLRMG